MKLKTKQLNLSLKFSHPNIDDNVIFSLDVFTISISHKKYDGKVH